MSCFHQISERFFESSAPTRGWKYPGLRTKQELKTQGKGCGRQVPTERGVIADVCSAQTVRTSETLRLRSVKVLFWQFRGGLLVLSLSLAGHPGGIQ